MNDDWKSIIGKYLSESGSNRVDFVRKKIRNDLKEYISYLSSFDKVRIESENYKELGDKSFEIIIVINLDKIHGGRISGAPFKIGINVNESGYLDIKYTVSYNWSLAQKAIFHPGDNDDPYTYKDEVIPEPERLEKEYLFQIINQRLVPYCDSFL